MFRKLIVVAVFVLTAAPVFAESPRPQQGGAGLDAAKVEKGKEAFSVACNGCHSANHVTIQRKPAAAWQRTVYTMIGRGAQVLADEIEPITAYLTANYGPSSPLPPVRGAAASAAPQMLPTGGEIVIRSCGGCHSINLIVNARKAAAGWRTTITNMRSYGAPVTAADEEPLANYLSTHFASR